MKKGTGQIRNRREAQRASCLSAIRSNTGHSRKKMAGYPSYCPDNPTFWTIYNQPLTTLSDLIRPDPGKKFFRVHRRSSLAIATPLDLWRGETLAKADGL